MGIWFLNITWSHGKSHIGKTNVEKKSYFLNYILQMAWILAVDKFQLLQRQPLLVSPEKSTS